MATYAIGDGQGSFEELQALLGAFALDRVQDRLWLVGDLGNRGPASLATLRFVRDLGDRAVSVLGFFFTSRRRHRRLQGDWSSDVCSSDLERVGASRSRRIDVRLVSATNADLHAEVSAGRFREDLLFWLNTIEIHLPPLRERSEERRVGEEGRSRWSPYH